MDTDEFILLIYKRKPQLISYLTEHLKDEDLAKDIFQDVTLKVVEALNDNREILNPDSYFFIMARNKVIDYWRKAASDRELREAYWQQIQHEQPTEPVGGFQIDLDFFQREINKSLSHQQRVIYEMSTRQGLSLDEIAVELGITKSTAKQHLILARKKIKECIEKYDVYVVLYAMFETLTLSNGPVV